MVSTSGNLLNAALKAVPAAAVTRAMSNPPRRRRGLAAPRGLRRRYDVTEHPVGAGAIVTAAPRSGSNGRHLVHLHGGAYTLQDQHWPFLGRFLSRGWTVSLVDYPLAPEHTVEDTVPMVLDSWRHLAGTTDRLDLAGDSAGGGLALVLLQQLRDAGEPMPHRTVLLSPWVDLVMDDAETVAAAPTDQMLSLEGLHGAARLYAGGRPLSDPWLSPLHAPMHDLGRIQAWVGTAEMFLPQCRRLADRAAVSPGTDLALHEGAGLPHDWTLFPIRESARTAEEMHRFYTS